MKITNLTLGDWMDLAGMTVAMFSSFPIAVGLLADNGTVLVAGLVAAVIGMIPVMVDHK